MSKLIDGLFGFSDMYWRPQMLMSFGQQQEMAQAQADLIRMQQKYATAQSRDERLPLLRAEGMRNAYKRRIAKRCEFCTRACYDNQQEQCNGCGAPL